MKIPYSEHKEYAVDDPLSVAITIGSTLLFTLREILRIHSHLFSSTRELGLLKQGVAIFTINYKNIFIEANTCTY